MRCTTHLRSWGELNRYKPPPVREAGQELIILSLELWSPFLSFASWFLSCSQRNIQTLYITASCRTREEQRRPVSMLEGPRCAIWFGRHKGNLYWPPSPGAECMAAVLSKPQSTTRPRHVSPEELPNSFWSSHMLETEKARLTDGLCATSACLKARSCF